MHGYIPSVPRLIHGRSIYSVTPSCECGWSYPNRPVRITKTSSADGQLAYYVKHLEAFVNLSVTDALDEAIKENRQFDAWVIEEALEEASYGALV